MIVLHVHPLSGLVFGGFCSLLSLLHLHQLAQLSFCYPNTMSRNRSVEDWLGPTRHPPRSLLRPILVLSDLRGLRPFVLHHFHSSAMESTTRKRVPRFFFLKDEGCFFTYAQYVEPLTSTAVTINDLRHALVHRILQTRGIHFRSAMLRLYITDHQDQEHILQGDDSLFQILGAYHLVPWG